MDKPLLGGFSLWSQGHQRSEVLGVQWVIVSLHLGSADIFPTADAKICLVESLEKVMNPFLSVKRQHLL